MSYESLTNKQLLAVASKAEKQIAKLNGKLEDLRQKTEAEIAILTAQKLEVETLYTSRTFKAETVTDVDWKALFKRVVEPESLTKSETSAMVQRTLALYEVSPGEVRHVSADDYNYDTKQPMLCLKFDHLSGPKLPQYATLLEQIIPYLALTKDDDSGWGWPKSAVHIDVKAPYDLDSGKPDGAPDDEFTMFVKADGTVEVWEVCTSCSIYGKYKTILAALEGIQDGLAYDPDENRDYDWETFDIDEFKAEHGVA